ncbi:helicase-related protein [Vibrio gallaecicus]|uniref:Helicase-related protein n=1 Tax=Vibrio gallaecicus TaxID=552386 RepID=A0ABV4NCS1_9VIBR
MSELPIDEHKSTFNQLIQNNHLVVEAETGSGKSTRLPIWAAEHGRVLVVEPRRIACTSLATYLAEQSGCALGEKIGYAIKLEAQFSPDTEVVFVTPGVALRWLADDGLKHFDIVMVDEFHERRWDIDLLVASLKENKSHRLIVTSATIEGEKLAAYIDGQRIRCAGRVFEVSYQYRARDSRHLPDIRSIEQNVQAEVERQIEHTTGDILVFLPGRKEITQCAQMLEKLNDRQLYDLIIVKLHASVSDEEKHTALTVNEKRKIILATNVAETSLTIPNVGVVIDSGLERRTVQRNGRTALSLKAISKASAKQRAGRAGRMMNGLCIRLYGEHAALELMTPPELQREELIEPMLTAAACGNPLQKLNFLNPLPERSVEQAKQALLLMEAVDQEGKITEHGLKIAPLPIDALYADIVTRISEKSLKEAMVDLTAALSVPANLYQLPSNSEALQELALVEKNGCDMSLLIGLVRGGTYPHIQIDINALNEAKGLAKQMREVFELPQIEAASRYQRQLLLKKIMELHPELVFVRRAKRKEAFSNELLEVLLGRQSRLPNASEAMLVFDTHSLPGRGVKQTLTLATVTAPLPLSLLSEAEIGQWHQGGTIVESNTVHTEMSLMYAGKIIATRLLEAEGELSLKPIIELVNQDLLLPGLAKLRRQEIKYWQLYVALGLSEAVKNTDEVQGLTFDNWLVEQLNLLGVESPEDVSLFSKEDILFDGIPYWEYEDFTQKYPFDLCLGDLQLSVEYLVSKKLVYVIHKSGIRKTLPKRWELPTWKGWRIQYKKASKIVDIK